MKTTTTLIAALLITQGSFYPVNAQANKEADLPEVGKPIPEYSFNKITHYKTTKASLKDFRGKWLFLDFWFTGCTACIKAFPKVNAFQQEFKDKVQFVLVGLNSYENGRGIEHLYEKLRQKLDLKLTVAYDSMFVDKWNIHAMPYIIIIDPEGIVTAITDGRDMTAEKIRDLISGKNVSFYSNNKIRTSDDPALTDTLPLYSSVFSKWNGQRQSVYLKLSDWFNSPRRQDGFRVSMATLNWLYNYAYFGYDDWYDNRDSLYGKVHRFPLLEISDPGLFEFDFSYDVGKGTYNYSLVVPEAMLNVGSIMKVMQAELKNIFGYEAVIEIRQMPVWKLVAKKGIAEKLKTRGGRHYFSGDNGAGMAAGFTIRNVPMRSFADLIMRYTGYHEPPLFDETGITGNIDITIDAIMTDMDDIRKALQANGLDMLKGTKEMKVLVLRDPQN